MPSSLLTLPRGLPSPQDEDAYNEMEEEEEDEYAAWAAAQDATYAQFDELLTSGPAATASPASAAKKPAAKPASSGRVTLNLRDVPRGPVKLAAKPQSSAAAREAAQRPAPPRLAPPPTLSAKPARPQQPTTESVPPATPELPAPLPVPQLAAKPQAAAAAAPQQAEEAAAPAAAAKPQPKRKAQRPSAAPAAPAAAPSPPIEQLAGKPSRPAARQPQPQPEPVQQEQQSAPAASQPEQQQPEQQQPEQPPSPAMDASEPLATEVPAAPPTPELQRPAAAKAAQATAAPQRQRVSKEEAQAVRRALNAQRGHAALLERSVETLQVHKANSAGVLVRNARLSGFIPTSLLSAAHAAAVAEREAPLLAAAAAGAIVAGLETGAQPATSADGADVTAAMRAAARKQALEGVLLGQRVSAVVVNVDDATGRVVLSGELCLHGG